MKALLLFPLIVVLVVSAIRAETGDYDMAIPDVAIEMQGDPNAHDSFVAGLCGILKSWNRDVDYAYVAGLSGIAFSPVLDTGEDCRAWWTEGGDDIRRDVLGQALGFTVEKIQVGTGGDDWEA